MYYQPQQQPFIKFLKGFPVSSLEDVKMTMIDFDGTVYYFPDNSNKCIYTKQFNMDGTILINKYQLVELPKPEVPEYITKAELLEILESWREADKPTFDFK